MTFRVRSGVHLRSMEGLRSCGDAALEWIGEDSCLFVVVDALGHGPDAERSAQAAIAAAREHAPLPLKEVFTAVDVALVGKRGAVMAALKFAEGQLTFAGVGNVEIFGPEGVSRPVSLAGTLGQGRFRFKEVGVPLAKGQRWALCTDGLKAREVGAHLKALTQLSPQDAATELVTRAGRAHDDACALVLDVEDLAP